MRALLLLLLLALPARAEEVTLPGPGGIALKARLFRPEGPVRAPAIVALHGCGGPFRARDTQWREALVAAGHVMLFPDSFGSRGLGSQCRERNRVATSSGLRRADAIAAAEWLATQPGIPPGIVLLGWSDGASTTVATARRGPDLPDHLFRGFIAFYPGCAAMRAAGYAPAAPLLILHGEADDWTPIAPCRAAVEAIGTPLIALHAYPGAYHDFDAPVPLKVLRDIPFSRNAEHTIHQGENPAARADALARVPAFLATLPP